MKYLVAVLCMSAAVLLVGQGADAGAKAGQKRFKDVKVPANGQVEYKVVFKANEKAEFACIGDKDTDVDLFVYDADGKLVASDVELSDLALVRWIPTKEQEYKIVVKNLGSVYNLCQLGHN
jgi:hypothetical protein